MELTEKARAIKGEGLAEFSRALYENGAAFRSVIAELAASDEKSDHELLADILSYQQLDGTEEQNFYADNKGSVGKRYLDMYISICRAAGLSEKEYIKPMLSAQYAKKSGALYVWDTAVDEYIAARCKHDFDGTAELVDEFDKGYGKYAVLMRADSRRAINRLLDKVIFGKGINKTAVRNVLRNRPEIAGALIGLYGEALAKQRAAIVRLLMLYKNDKKVSDFLYGVALNDKSKTVRDLFSSPAPKARGAAKYFENLMASGEGITFGELKSLVNPKKSKPRDKEYAAVADRILFFNRKDGFDPYVFVCDGGKFYDMTGAEVSLKNADTVYVLHPLDIPESMREVLPAGVDQPFPQLSRVVYVPQADERYTSDRLLGTMVSRKDFDAAFRREGFSLCEKRDDEPYRALKILGDYAVTIECELNETDGSVVCGVISFLRSRDIVRLNKKNYVSGVRAVDIRELPQKSYSELMYFSYKLFSAA